MIPEIVVLFLTMHNTVTSSPSNERRCFYYDLSQQFEECVKIHSNRLNLDRVMYELMETDFTGEDLLFRLSSTCRNEQVLNTYRNCTSRAIADCPHLASVITKEVNESLSVFCEHGAPSAWLNTILQNGYLHKKKCTEDRIGNEVLDMVIECGQGFMRDWTGDTFDSGISTLQTHMYKCKISQPVPFRLHSIECQRDSHLKFNTFARRMRLIQHLFQCMIDNGPSLSDQEGDGVLDCGSSWQDIVLAYALRLSSIEKFGMKIGEEEINELQAIRTD